MNPSLVIFLHGVGSNGEDLLSLGQVWSELLPVTQFVGPDAPFAFEGGGPGRQWFSVAGVTEANRPARVKAAREPFDVVIRRVIAGKGFADQLDRVALVGFSQGSIMALDAVASGRWPVAAVVAFSGRLASPEPFTPSLQTRVLLIHGTADAVMPMAESRQAQTRLKAAGVAAELRELPGLGHAISPEAAGIAGRYLASFIMQA